MTRKSRKTKHNQATQNRKTIRVQVKQVQTLLQRLKHSDTFIPSGKATFPWVYIAEGKKSCEVHKTYQAHIEPRLGYQVVPVG